MTTKEGKNIVVKIKATNMNLTPAIENYVRVKLMFLEKSLIFFGKESGELIFEVEIGKTTHHHHKGEVFRAEINFNSDSTHFRSEAVKEDLYAAIDEAKDEMQGDLRKLKSKKFSLMREGGARLKKLLWFGRE